MTTVLLRVDDVGRDDWPTAFVLAALAAGGFPVGALVVPAWLTAPVARFLAGLPGLTVVQHGFAHADHSHDGERKYEFGPSRTPSQQKADLRAGRALLERWFDSAPPLVFAPPHDRLDQSTLDALAELSYSLCLGSERTFTGLRIAPGLATLAFTIDAGRRTPSGREARPAGEVVAEVLACSASLAGVVLHPGELKGFALAAELLDELAGLRRQGVRFAALCPGERP